MPSATYSITNNIGYTIASNKSWTVGNISLVQLVCMGNNWLARVSAMVLVNHGLSWLLPFVNCGKLVLNGGG